MNLNIEDNSEFYCINLGSEIDPEAAGIVSEIFDMRIVGAGFTEIARNLNDRGIKCSAAIRRKRVGLQIILEIWRVCVGLK